MEHLGCKKENIDRKYLKNIENNQFKKQVKKQSFRVIINFTALKNRELKY